MSENLPAWHFYAIDVDIGNALGIDGDDNTLITKFLRSFTDEFRCKNRG